MKIVIHSNTTATVTNQEPILVETLLKQNGFTLSMPCGGNHTCGKCRVRIIGSLSPKSDREIKLLGNADKDIRLACFTQIVGDSEIFLNEDNAKIISDGFVSRFPFEPMGGQYGFAVDIGTTTVAVYLYDLKTGLKLGQTAFSNPQSAFGGDVISRIEASMNGNSSELQKIIGEKISAAFTLLCDEHKISKDEADIAVITGNTTMLYLLLGKDTACLSAAPFEITDYLDRAVSAKECGIYGFPRLSVYLPRSMAAFVGSDITCSVLAASDLLESPNASVLIDIGTNGEMAIKKGEKIFCCSTAAGPAFEGAGITMGSMAVSGAINKVWLDENRICFTTIDEDVPRGICGSGLIDAIATFVECGLIDESGCIDDCNEDFSQYIGEYNDQIALKIGESNIVLTQNDIRAVQLAKSAIRAGIESLLNACDITAEKIDNLILAGGFGSYIDVKNAAVIGLIPKQLQSKAKAVGNAAGMGATAILLSKTAQKAGTQLAESANILDLSTCAFFMDAYVENMMF